MNLHIYKISPIICIYAGLFLMNLHTHKSSPIVCVYTGCILTTHENYKDCVSLLESIQEVPLPVST